MIELEKYSEENKNETVLRIAQFFGFHNRLLNQNIALDESNYTEAEKTLYNWISADQELYMILSDLITVGFIHLGYRGGNVAWIEDIYVDENCRGKGIATKAIQIAEELIKTNRKYTSVCIDVAPRNTDALKLYHQLGYDSLSIITVRKEFYDNKRDKIENVLGLDYKI